VKYLPLKLIFLGVGGWISDPRLGHTSILIVSSKGKVLLLDAGESVARALYEHGFRVKDLEAVVLTHMHGDHVLGFPTLVMIAKNYEKTTLKAYIHRDHVENVKTLLRTVGVDYENIVSINSVKPGDSLYAGEFKLEFRESCHVQSTLAVRVEVEGFCIVYSSDTAPCNSVVELAKNCNILIHEASGYDPWAHVYGHSTVEDAIQVAIEAGVKKLILVHYYLEKPPLRARILLGVDVYLAHPGEVITI
jgi:ribonuclease Z